MDMKMSDVLNVDSYAVVLSGNKLYWYHVLIYSIVI